MSGHRDGSGNLTVRLPWQVWIMLAVQFVLVVSFLSKLSYVTSDLKEIASQQSVLLAGHSARIAVLEARVKP